MVQHTNIHLCIKYLLNSFKETLNFAPISKPTHKIFRVILRTPGNLINFINLYFTGIYARRNQ